MLNFLSQDNRFSITLLSALAFKCTMVPIINFVDISLPVNFDSVHAEICFDKINSMENKILSILSEEILKVSLSRSISMPSQVRFLVGCHTDLSELTIKPALANEIEPKVDFSRPLQKCCIYLGRHLKTGNF